MECKVDFFVVIIGIVFVLIVVLEINLFCWILIFEVGIILKWFFVYGVFFFIFCVNILYLI